MKVEIWSDVVCPFCYIGKRKFEKALQQFEYKDEVEVLWHSYQLNPFIKYQPARTIHEYMSEHKGISISDSKKMRDEIIERAIVEGLVMNMDNVVPANSLDAHRLLQFALKLGLQDEAEERLFKAYFTDGENIEDKQTLKRLGVEIGLDPVLLTKLLESDQFLNEVDLDFHEAQLLGVSGVPFFLFDSKYTVSGAQESNYFLKVLTKVWAEKK